MTLDQFAFDAEQPEAAEIWLLVESLLTDVVPKSEPEKDLHSQLHVQSPLSPLTGMHPGLPHSISAPAALPGSHRDQSPGADLKTKTAMPEAALHPHRNTYPSPRLRTHADLSAANTPNSSSPSSPQRPSPSLPPITLAGTPIPASVFARRASAAGVVPGVSGSHITRHKPNSSYRRPSVSAKSVLSTTESQASLQSSGGAPGTSYRSPGLRYVGDGALSDSDSSGNEEDHEDGLGGDDEPETTPDPANDEGSGGDIFGRPHISPYLLPRNPALNRSPLSRIVRQRDWRSDEDEDRLSSSASSDSDVAISTPGHKRRVVSSSYYPTSAMKTSADRKRSNTVNSKNSIVASFSANTGVGSTVGSVTGSGSGTGGLSIPKRVISKQESHSSIRTVVAVSENATPTREVPDPYSSYSQGGVGQKSSETPRKVSNGESGNGSTGKSFVPGHQKQRSEAAMSELLLDDPDESRSQSQSQRGGPGSVKQVSRQSETVIRRRREDIEEAERRFRDSGWDAVKESLEIYAEEVRSAPDRFI